MQKSNATRFFGASLLYFLSSLFSKAAVFFLLPLYTARIPAAEMGQMDASVAVAVLIATSLFLDVGVAILRFYGAAEGEGRETVLSSGFLLMLLSALGYLALALGLSFFLEIPYFFLTVLYGLANALFLAASHVARAVGARLRYALSGVLSTLLQVTLAALLLLAFDMGVSALYIAYAVGALFGALVALSGAEARRALRTRPNKRTVCEMLRFSLPLGLSALCFWVLSSLGRVVALVAYDEASAGVFAISLKFSQLVLLTAVCAQLGWQELALTDRGGEDSARDTARTDLFLRVSEAFLLLLLPLAALLLILFPRFLGEGYEGVFSLLPYAFLASFGAVVATFFEPLLGREGRTGALLATTVAGALLNALLLSLTAWLQLPPFCLHLASSLSFLLVALLRAACLSRRGLLHLRPLRYLLVLPPLAALVASYTLPTLACQALMLLFALPCAALLLWPELRRALGHRE